MIDRTSEIRDWQQQLDQHRRNAQELRKQQALFGIGARPLAQVAQLSAEEDSIRQAKAALRILGEASEHLPGDPDDLAPFPDELAEDLPFPVAIACHHFNLASEPVERFRRLDELVQSVVKYLAAIALAQYRSDSPDEVRLGEWLRGLSRPTLASWAKMLDEVCAYYRSAGATASRVALELVTALDRNAGERSALALALRFAVQEVQGKKAARGLTETTPGGFLRAWVAYRSRWEGGDPAAGEAQKVSEILQPALHELLDGLTLITTYPLRYVEREDRTKDDWVYTMLAFQGHDGTPVPLENPFRDPSQADKPAYARRRLYLCAPDGRPLLNLHPILISYLYRLHFLEYNADNQQICYRPCQGGEQYYPPAYISSYLLPCVSPGEEPGERCIGDKLDDASTNLEAEERTSGTLATPLAVLFTHFAEDAILAMQTALGEALRIGHFWLGLEFLLMGLSKQEEGVLPVALAEIGVDPGRLRGALRGRVGIQPQVEKTWRHQDAQAVGMEGWGLLQEIDPATAAADYAAGKAPKAGVTPRMMAVLREAVRLAGEDKAGPDHLLLAALQHPQSLAINLLLGQVAQAGHDPAGWAAELLRRAGGARAEKAPEGTEPERRAPQAVQPPVRGEGLLGRLGRDLTALAKAQPPQLRPAIGEAARRAMGKMGEILLQAEGNNPILLGDPGVGKTAIVEGFAWRLANDPKVMQQFAGRRIVDLPPTALLAGTKYRGDLEQRLQQVLAEVAVTKGQTVIFIDEIHTILGGRAEGGLGAISDALKPALSRGEFPCIGATTVAEYRRYIESDPALARRFTPVWIEEPSPEEAFQIAKTVAREHLAERHGVAYPDETVREAVRLAVRYLHDEFLPGKVIRLLDQAGPRVILGGSLSGRKGDDVSVGGGEVTVETVRAIAAERTGIPLTRLSEDDRARLKMLEARLKERVKGQDQAVQAIVAAVKRARAGLGDPLRPQGVFLFAGPTGVGKTELALALAEALFDDQDAILRVDMSEYLEKHQVSRLIGSPPGYIGHEEEGQLTGRLRRRPYSVVLLDEIEKAHPDVQHLFLQLFDAGRLTDSRGRLADGRNAIFIMTTNLGTREAMGFISEPATYEENLQKAIDDFFSPEFRNRIQRIIYFRPVNQVMLEAIFDKLFERAAARFRAQGIEVVIDPALKIELCKRYVSSKEGARPLERAIEDEIVVPLVEKLLDGELAPGQRMVMGPRQTIAASDVPQAARAKAAAAEDEVSGEPAAGELGLDPQEVRARGVLASRLEALNEWLRAQGIMVIVEEGALELLCSPFWQRDRRDLDTAAAFAELVEKPLLQRVQAGDFQAGVQVEAYRDLNLAIAFRKLEGKQA
jgi:ATP-dependent Clp protease ATP-binding subunit ClpC